MTLLNESPEINLQLQAWFNYHWVSTTKTRIGYKIAEIRAYVKDRAGRPSSRHEENRALDILAVSPRAPPPSNHGEEYLVLCTSNGLTRTAAHLLRFQNSNRSACDGRAQE